MTKERLEDLLHKITSSSMWYMVDKITTSELRKVHDEVLEEIYKEIK